MRNVALVLAAAAMLATTVAHAEAPKFQSGMSYDKVRASLLRRGWQPMSLVPAGQCGWDADQCPKVPEVIFCAGANDASCFYAWEKAGKFLEIHANTEGVPQKYVSTMTCKAIVRGDPRYITDYKCVGKKEIR